MTAVLKFLDEIGNLREHEKFENIGNVFNITQKNEEHSEEILNVECLEEASPSWTRLMLVKDQSDQVGEGKSMCVR